MQISASKRVQQLAKSAPLSSGQTIDSSLSVRVWERERERREHQHQAPAIDSSDECDFSQRKKEIETERPIAIDLIICLHSRFLRWDAGAGLGEVGAGSFSYESVAALRCASLSLSLSLSLSHQRRKRGKMRALPLSHLCTGHWEVVSKPKCKSAAAAAALQVAGHSWHTHTHTQPDCFMINGFCITMNFAN